MVGPIQNIVSQASRNVTMLGIALSLTFCILTLPLKISIIVLFTHGRTTQLIMALLVMESMSSLNHCVNLYICVLVDKDFRKSITQLFVCKLCHTPSTNHGNHAADLENAEAYELQ